MLNKNIIACTVMLLLSANTWAEETDLIQPPVIPESLQDGESIEPEVNIIQRDDRIIEEYRVGGRLYMIKVTPVRGLPYYLMDTDGNGSLETTQHELSDGILIPNWILYKW